VDRLGAIDTDSRFLPSGVSGASTHGNSTSPKAWHVHTTRDSREVTHLRSGLAIDG